MDLEKAIIIVLELARDNILEETNQCPILEGEKEKQKEACNTVEDFFVNNVFD